MSRNDEKDDAKQRGTTNPGVSDKRDDKDAKQREHDAAAKRHDDDATKRDPEAPLAGDLTHDTRVKQAQDRGAGDDLIGPPEAPAPTTGGRPGTMGASGPPTGIVWPEEPTPEEKQAARDAEQEARKAERANDQDARQGERAVEQEAKGESRK